MIRVEWGLSRLVWTTRFIRLWHNLVTKDLSNMKADTSDDEHLEELEDGAGCTEIWEHLSEQRSDGVASDD